MESHENQQEDGKKGERLAKKKGAKTPTFATRD